MNIKIKYFFALAIIFLSSRCFSADKKNDLTLNFDFAINKAMNCPEEKISYSIMAEGVRTTIDIVKFINGNSVGIAWYINNEYTDGFSKKISRLNDDERKAFAKVIEKAKKDCCSRFLWSLHDLGDKLCGY